jgi:hypothetical protein
MNKLSFTVNLEVEFLIPWMAGDSKSYFRVKQMAGRKRN